MKYNIKDNNIIFEKYTQINEFNVNLDVPAGRVNKLREVAKDVVLSMQTVIYNNIFNGIIQELYDQAIENGASNRTAMEFLSEDDKVSEVFVNVLFDKMMDVIMTKSIFDQNIESIYKSNTSPKMIKFRVGLEVFGYAVEYILQSFIPDSPASTAVQNELMFLKDGVKVVIIQELLKLKDETSYESFVAKMEKKKELIANELESMEKQLDRQGHDIGFSQTKER